MNNRIIRIVVSMSAISLLNLPGCGVEQVGRPRCENTVKDFDMVRFAGVWHEIARIPSKEEKDLEAISLLVTLTDGREHIIIHNSYNTEIGGWQMKTGKIWAPDTTWPGCMRISFLMFFGGDFQVLDIDHDNYSWAIVKSSSQKSAWILSRDIFMDKNTLKRCLMSARINGIRTRKLVRVEHNTSNL